MKEKTSQPTTSLKIAEAMMTMPISVLKQLHVEQDPGDHRQGGDGHGGAEKEGEEQMVRVAVRDTEPLRDKTRPPQSRW